MIAWFGCLAGISLTLLCGAFLAVASRGFHKQALPTRIFVPERQGNEDEGEEGEDDRKERFRR